MSASREKHLRQELAESGALENTTELEKEQAKKEKRSNALYITVAVLFLAALAASIVWRSNIIGKKATAVTVNGENYTAAEVNFYYQNGYNNFLNSYSYLVSYMGLDTTAPLAGQVMNETAVGMLGAAEGTTWQEYFLDQAAQQIAAIQIVLDKAEAEGYTYTDAVQQQYDDTMESIKTTAAASGASMSAYLQGAYGPLMSEKVFSEQLMLVSKYSDYINSYYMGLEFSDADIEAAYEADRNSYDRIAYQTVSIPGAAASTTDANGNPVEPTEAETEAALKKAEAAAEKMLADYKAGGDLKALADAVEGATYTNNAGSSYFSTDLGLWMFDEARKDGDTTVLLSGSTYYVAVFGERFREETPTRDIRHILIATAEGTLASTDEGYEAEQAQLKADAKAAADALLAEWKAGAATEESFGALAGEHTDDPGSQTTGGLYENVYEGQMVTEFNDWCFDSSRKAGDTGVVETSYGAHVMYYVGENVPMWKYEVDSALRSNAYNEWLTNIPVGSTITPNSFGMSFVG